MRSTVLLSLKRFLVGAIALGVSLGARADTSQISPEKPVVNFRLPNFTPEGNRSWLVRGSEAYYLAKENQIDVRELTLSIFSGKSDDKLMTMVLSPIARVQPNESIVTGTSTIRVINDDYEATGTGWSCAPKEKKVIILKKVRVSFRAEIKEFLK